MGSDFTPVPPGKPDPWEVLGVPPGASPSVVHEAYLTLVRRYHPDRYFGDAIRYRLAEERMKAINQAYHAIKTGAAPTVRPTPPARPPRPPGAPPTPTCILHGQPIGRRCPICGRGFCTRCADYSAARCAHHAARPKSVRQRGTRSIRPVSWLLWVPPAAVTLGMWRFRVDALIWVLFIYLACVGFTRILGWKTWGVVVAIIFPYCLVFLGAWHLVSILGSLGSGRRPPGRWG